MMVKDTCVYLHKKPNGEVFYAGIGNIKRPYSKFRYNPHWKNVVKKYPNYIIEILNENLDWKTACKIEIELISKFKRKIDGGILCNITLGGDGVKGHKHSEETKQKLKILSTGNKNCIGFKHSEEAKKNMSLAHLGNKITEETKLKMSLRQKGRASRPSDKLNVLKAHEKIKGRIQTEQEKLKRANSLKKPIQVFGVFYKSIGDYCIENKKSKCNVWYKLKDEQNKNYNYIKKI